MLNDQRQPIYSPLSTFSKNLSHKMASPYSLGAILHLISCSHQLCISLPKNFKETLKKRPLEWFYFYFTYRDIASKWPCLYIVMTNYQPRATRQKKPENKNRSLRWLTQGMQVNAPNRAQSSNWRKSVHIMWKLRRTFNLAMTTS